MLPPGRTHAHKDGQPENIMHPSLSTGYRRGHKNALNALFILLRNCPAGELTAPSRLALRVGDRRTLSMHSSNEPGELLQ